MLYKDFKSIGKCMFPHTLMHIHALCTAVVVQGEDTARNERRNPITF